MPRGYMEGPAAEEAERRADELARGTRHSEAAPLYPAVFGCTDEDPRPHFLGWRSDVDPDELFASGKAWGVTVRRIAAAQLPVTATSADGLPTLPESSTARTT